jgi:hypothetical protein
MWKIGVAIAIALAVGWFALPAVRTQLIALAPFAIVLLCPLAMLFGMRGHGQHGGGDGGHGSHGRCCGGDGDGRDAPATSDHSDHQKFKV